MKLRILILLIVTILAGGACGSVGTPFKKTEVAKIKSGVTSKNYIRRTFGKPFRTGIENGREVWVYEYNVYSAFGQTTLRDLLIVFDDKGNVFSHQVMSSSP